MTEEQAAALIERLQRREPVSHYQRRLLKTALLDVRSAGDSRSAAIVLPRKIRARLRVSAGDCYGDVVLTGKEGQPKGVDRAVEGRCVCGSVKEFRLASLRSGNTSSCGCRRRRFKRLSLSGETRFHEIVDGLLLGDGCLAPDGVLLLSQTTKNGRRLWLDQVRAELEAFGCTATVVERDRLPKLIRGRSVQGGRDAILRTRTYQELKDARRRWYPKGKKRVPRDLVLTPRVLAHWFAGDGSGTPHSLVFYTNGFLKTDVHFLVRGLSRLGVEAHAASARQGSAIIVVGKARARAQLNALIRAHLPECFLYKLRFERTVV